MLKKIVLLFFYITLLFADKAITPKDYQKMLKTGIDVNWALYKKEIKYFSNKEVFDLKKVGFSHIRVRFGSDFKRLGMSEDEYLLHLQKVVNLILKNGLIPILAYDAKEFKKDPSFTNLDKVVKYWIEIAKIFKNYPHKLAFDIIIEPGKKLNKKYKILNILYKKVINNIRKINPKRIIFIAPIRCSSPLYLKKLNINNKDKYLMIEWHFYAAGPSITNPKKLWTNGNLKQKELVIKKIKIALKWLKQHKMCGWVGAWMPSDYNHGNHYNISKQIRFANFMSCSLYKYHIPFAINADQKFYDFKTNKWFLKRYKVLKTILYPQCLDR